jgi:hypothetical protein
MAGDPDFALSHAVAWAALAAKLRGRWDDALQLGDTLVAMRENTQRPPGRFTFPGWAAVLHVATARQDATRVARYRSAYVATADFENLVEPNRSAWLAQLDHDGAAARRFLASSFHLPDRKGELLAMLALELGERLEESELAALEREALGNPPILVLRIRLARALNAGIPQLREAIAALDAGDHVADAARATAMLALRTRDERDQADAARRLDALGDRAYRQRLAEDWTAA